jgi:deazaflavin-dependent oxidoreductase (nitroreductase family)
MPAIRRTTLTEIMWKLHRFAYRASGGRVGTAIGGTPVLLLTTSSRRSGEPRPVTLTYLEDGGRFVVVASNAGENRHPARWLNLEEHPDATVQIGGTTTRVRPAEAAGEERERL